jgi:hypothetical protein
MKKTLFIAMTGFLFNLAACTRLNSERPYKMIGIGTAGLQAVFNADVGKVRVLMLVSPTCGACLNRASEVSEQLVNLEHGKNAAIYVVWVPRLNGLERNVPRRYKGGRRIVGAAILGWQRSVGSAVRASKRLERQCIGCLYDLWPASFVISPFSRPRHSYRGQREGSPLRTGAEPRPPPLPDGTSLAGTLDSSGR